MEAFPTTPRVPAWVRLCAMAIGLAGVLLATTTTVTSARWIGRVFPGFLLMDNGVIVSIGLPHWSGASVPDLFQSELVRVNGRPLRSVQEAYATVAALPPDTAVRYEVRKYGRTREVTLRTQRFTLGD